MQRPVDWIVGCRTGLSVSDLINQFWCEQQFEYSFTNPLSRPTPETVAIGATIHRERGMSFIYVISMQAIDSWAKIIVIGGRFFYTDMRNIFV